MSGALRKFVFKCVTPQQDLAGNMYALENGNDLLYKEVAECRSISEQRKKLVTSRACLTHLVRSFDWQPVWLNLQYQKTPLPIRLNHEYVSMLFHIHSPWSYVCLGPCHERLTHTACLVGCLKRLANYTAFCLSLQKAQLSLVGVWPDVFPVVLYCRMWWWELCPMVVVLARMPLTGWLRRWNMLIKLKTTSKNLHQIMTLVVSGAMVRLIYCEMFTCWHACMSVYLCLCVRQMICVWWLLSESVSCGQHHDAGIFDWLFDKSCHSVTVSEFVSSFT